MKEKSKIKNKKSKIRKIKLLILDVDGVMTDGSIIYDDKGNEYKIFNVHDGYGIELVKKAGIKYKLDMVEVCAIGDDLLDLGMMKKIGLPVAVRNARPEVKRIAKYITDADGGKGAIREVTDLLVQAR